MKRHVLRWSSLFATAMLSASSAFAQGGGSLTAQPLVAAAGPDSLRVQLADADLRAAVQALAQYLDRPLLFGNLPGGRVSIATPLPIARRDVVPLLRSLLESQNHELIADSSGTWRIRMRDMRPLAGSSAGPNGSRAGSTGAPELFVIRLRHARAADVSATVNALYGRAAALGELGARAAPLSEQIQQAQAPPPNTPVTTPSVSGGRVASFGGDVTIVPDPSTNSLLVRAARTDYELIMAAVQELDLRPLQVLIEVHIVEVRKDRSLSFGVGVEAGPRTVGVQGTVISGSSDGIGLGDLLLKVMRIGGEDITATLRASAARGDAVIISRPVLLATNNEKAVINVGSQRPFVQVSRSLPTSQPQRDQVVQYKDVGTTLTVRPTINTNGYVTLEVTQDVNNATAETQFDAPIISTRSVQTKLLMRDSQTVILGGLTDQQRETRGGGVPFLSSIPLLGALFGRSSRTATASELFIFITPRILRTDADADRQTEARRKEEPK